MSKQYFNKLDTVKLAELKEINLAKLQEVKLSLIDDAEKLEGRSSKLIGELEAYLDDFRTAELAYEDAISKMSDFITETKSEILTGNDLLDDIMEMGKELDKSADALGLNPNDIPASAALEQIYGDLNEAVENLEDAALEAERLV